jgi:exosortase/archaeosortase
MTNLDLCTGGDSISLVPGAIWGVMAQLPVNAIAFGKRLQVML